MMVRWAIAGVLCLGLMLAAQPASAQSCNFSISDFIFGSINLAANTSFTTTATYSASCTGTANTTVRTCPNIDAGSGGSTSGNPRFLLNGGRNSISMSTRTAPIRRSGAPICGLRGLICVADDRRCPQRQRRRQRFANRVRPDLRRPADPAGGALFSSFAGAQTSIAYAYSTIGTCATIGTSHATTPIHSDGHERDDLLVSASTLNFGATGVLRATLDATSTITVTCTNTAPIRSRSTAD